MALTTTTYGFILKDYPDFINQMEVKAAALAAEGKTDNIPYKHPVLDPAVDPMVISRTWIDIAAADEWKLFVETVIPFDPDIYPYTIEITA
jgi:hypothetical protein